MLVVLTIASVWLGWYVQGAKQQAAAVRRVLERDGEIHYDFEFNDDASTDAFFRPKNQRSPFPSWVLDIVGYDFFHEVWELSLIHI